MTNRALSIKLLKKFAIYRKTQFNRKKPQLKISMKKRDQSTSPLVISYPCHRLISLKRMMKKRVLGSYNSVKFSAIKTLMCKISRHKTSLMIKWRAPTLHSRNNCKILKPL